MISTSGLRFYQIKAYYKQNDYFKFCLANYD